MKDYRTHLESLRKQAAESALIGALATDPAKARVVREARNTLKHAGG
jgi:hypothetical protein